MHVLFILLSFYISKIFCDISYYSGSRSCPRYSFTCSNGECIPSTHVCDGAKNCTDGSDETKTLCDKYAPSCPLYGFLCAYGACIDKFRTCDGIQDCADNSDELLPKCFNLSSSAKICKRYEFQCDSGQCIDELLICDGKSHCTDKSDETITQCINFGCPSYGFKCAYGGCINESQKCDGTQDCNDGSDEEKELCSVNDIEETSTTVKPKPSRQPTWHHGSGCRLPEKPTNGNYEVVDCIRGDYSSKCRKVPDTIVSTNTALKYSCNPGYVLSIESNPIFCKNGNWDHKPPECQKLCNGVYSDSLDLECYDRDILVDCGKPMRPGTEVRVKCKIAYHYDQPHFNTTRCLPDGRLANKLFKCLPDCGISNKPVVSLIQNGTVAQLSKFPWHAGFYEFIDEQWKYSCGGSIIHPKAILSAAHCVYDEKIFGLKNKNKMAVAVGKIWSKWDHVEDKKTEQHFGLTGIYYPEKYRGSENRYSMDIAILHLDKPIKFQSSVMPVCLDIGKKLLLDGPENWNVFGTVIGSGATEDGGPVSEQLMFARLPLLDYRTCLKKISRSKYITNDKFCAGLSTEGVKMQKGDSGSALTLARYPYGYEQHYIHGIVSIRPLENENITLFTQVSFHMDWIEDVRNAIDKNK